MTAAVPAVRAVSTDIVHSTCGGFSGQGHEDRRLPYSETFSKVEDFVNKGSFVAGSYEIEAWYGDPGAQGFVKKDEDEYTHAYYYGKTVNVNIIEGETTEVRSQCRS